jgi:hypothetical protein
MIIAYSKRRPNIIITTADLRNLISHGEPINDEVMYLFLEIFCSLFNYTFITEKLTTLLHRNGWSTIIARYFANDQSQRSINKPYLTQEPAIAIPCFVNGGHWVAVVRREIKAQVYFLYSDDLNQESTERHLKELFSSCPCQVFYPSTAIWINCKATTYHPHSNECGPRSLLAISIMMLHPDPNEDILMEYMSSNLAQITRTWVATILLTGQPIIPPIHQQSLSISSNVMSASSNPSSLIPWTNPYTTQFTNNSLFDSTLGNIASSEVSRTEEGNQYHNETKSTKNSHIKEELNIPAINRRKTTKAKFKQSTRSLPSQKQPKITQWYKPITGVSSQTGANKVNVENGPKFLERKQCQSGYTESSIASPITKKYSPQNYITDFRQYPSTQDYPTDESQQTWGHSLEIVDTSEVLRVVLQNPNGLKTTKNATELQLSLRACHSIGTGVICLPETNANWSNSSNHTVLKSTIKQLWRHSAIQTSHTSENFYSNYQPGGTVTLVTDNWTSRIIERGTDPFGLGRWSFFTLRGSQHRKITIVTGYRVCNSSPSTAGVKTAYMQQYRSISAKLRSTKTPAKPNPHRQFILDLQAWLEHLIADGHQIILAMDSNEELQSSVGSFQNLPYNPEGVTQCTQHDGHLSTLVRTCGLLDILTIHHTGNPPPTYNRGKQRLDYIFVSHPLSPTILRSGILPFYSLFLSDHRPCYIDIDANSLFNEPTPQITTSDQRALQLLDPDKVNKYIGAAKDQVAYHKIMEKMRDLRNKAQESYWNPSDFHVYETIDSLNTQIMRNAERKLKRKYSKKYDWSPALAHAIYSTHYWRLKLKRSKGLLVSNAALRTNKQKAHLPDSCDAITSRQAILEHLRAAIKNEREKQSNHVPNRRTYLEELAESLVLNRGKVNQNSKKLNKEKAKQVQALIQ